MSLSEAPYALEYLIELKKRGMKLAVATGLPGELFLPCLEHNSVLELFDILCSTDEVKRGKEYPDVFELAAQRLGAAPQHCLVFEDVLPAVKSAKQAGMLVCAVYDKYSARYRVQMEQAADFYIADFRDAPLPDADFEDENEKE
ncbi:HAD family hydrolase [Enterocloster clostridioformis]|uniref:HAD family hydrolase n=2 Tax=Enterocloster clostridioformis TaxID=1531 RepID=UPI0034A33D4D